MQHETMAQQIAALPSVLWEKHPHHDATIKQLIPVKPVRLPQHISVRKNSKLYRLRLEDIIRCVAESNYCWIHFGTGAKIMMAKTLKALSHTLPASGFVRVHRSHIVRKDEIHFIHKDHIVLYNGDTIPMSRRSKKYVNQQLNESISKN